MKIVYIHDAIACIGGVERIFAEKMNYLADILGYEVYLITSIQGNHPFSFSISPKVKHIDLGVSLHSQYEYKYPTRLWKKLIVDNLYKRKLNNEIQRINPSIIISTSNFKPDVICQLNCNAKKVIESHCARSYTGVNDGINRNQLMQWLHGLQIKRVYKLIEKKCDIVITLTLKDFTEWRKARKVQIIPNMTLFVTSNNGIKKKSNHAISIGRMSYQKGFDRLISAWEIVKQEHADWSLDIYGDNGALKLDVEKQIDELNLKNEITIHVPTDKITEKYQESEFYVMSSRYEGWGLVLVEAMACGIPCIAFDCPYGPSDIIEHGVNGLLVKNGDIQGLADAICWMIEHEEERKQMGIAAKETSKKYAPEVIMKQWDELFKELVKQ